MFLVIFLSPLCIFFQGVDPFSLWFNFFLQQSDLTLLVHTRRLFAILKRENFVITMFFLQSNTIPRSKWDLRNFKSHLFYSIEQSLKYDWNKKIKMISKLFEEPGLQYVELVAFAKKLHLLYKVFKIIPAGYLF